MEGNALHELKKIKILRNSYTNWENFARCEMNISFWEIIWKSLIIITIMYYYRQITTLVNESIQEKPPGHVYLEMVC